MRKTSHDGVDTTSITSGIENEVKKSCTGGILKIKKSSIKRKVPNFSHESDDGIVEPLLQSEKEKSESAPRSAKYLLSKTKTDSISENEDSINMTEINISNFSASTPITAVNKVTDVTTVRNHMNTNVFCAPEVSKTIISTKSPILVELDSAKTTSYNPSLIFTTAKIHSDCKTKLMDPVQVTQAPIISTTEKAIEASGNSSHEMKTVDNKASDTAYNVFDIKNKGNKGLNTDNKSNIEDIRNNSTSKAIINLTEKSMSDRWGQNMPNTLLSKNTAGNNILIKTDTKNANFTLDLSNANIKNTEQNNFMIHPIKPKEETKEKSGTKDNNSPTSSFKSATEQSSTEKSDKKITIQGSKKLQRQKKATIEESQDTTSTATINKDKPCSDENKKPTVSQTKTATVTSTTPSIIATASAQISESKSNNVAKNVTSQTVSSKIPSQVWSVPKTTHSKIQTPVSNNVTSQTSVSSKIPSPVSIPKAINSKIQIAGSKNLSSQPIVSCKIHSQEPTTTKLPDSKSQTPVSKMPTPTTPITNIVTKSFTQTPNSKTFQGTGDIKPASLNKKGENLDSINKNESPLVTKLAAKEIAPVATDNSSPVPKTLPPYIVSTSKTKIGAPVVTSATLKSDANKLASSTHSYLVKTTPAMNLNTTTSLPTPVTTSASFKSEVNKSAGDSKSSMNLAQATPVTSLNTVATSATTTVATSATLKSEANKSVSDSNSSTNSYLVKTTPITSLKTITTSAPTPVTTGATLKSETNKLASDTKNSTNLEKTTPTTSLKTTTTSVPTPSISASLKSETNKPTKLGKTTPTTSFKTTTTSVPIPSINASLKSEGNKSAIDAKGSTSLVKTTPATGLKTTTTSVQTPIAASATLKSEANKSAIDAKGSTSLVKTTPATGLKTTTTSVQTPIAASATLKSESNKSANDSKSSTSSYLAKTTSANSLKTTTASVPTTASSSSQGTKQSGPVKQTKSNTDKQKGGSKA